MASTENQQHTFPAAPPSLSAGDHEMRDYYAARDASQPPLNQEPYLTPYLGLRARLSQTWINRWTILLLLVLIRTLLAIASLDHDLGSARTQALSACTSVENVGSAMASMPYYMSQGVNKLTADGIEKSINGLMQMLILSVTGVEEIVVFVINMLTSMYVCLITLAVSGSLHVAIDVAEDVGSFLNSTAKAVGQDLRSAEADFAKLMDSFMAGIDDLGSLITGKHLTPPTINLTSSIATLDNLQLPSDYYQGLNTLNASIPTFAQVNNFTNNAIKLPFEEVKKLLNESLPKYTMNSSLFPVPAKQELTFCSDNNGINTFFDDLVHIEQLARKIFLVVLIILAILACVPMAYREIRQWRFMRERAKLVQNSALDPMDAVYLASRPYTSTAGLKLSNRLDSSRRQTLIRWSIAYATTVPALFVLSLAIAGLLGCLCQYILLKAIGKEVPAIANEIGAFANEVVAQLEDASQQWMVGTNDIINATNIDINKDVFGWVNTTTAAVNNTLNVFVDDMVNVLNVTFGGTVLYTPILDVMNCLIFLKIQGIEKGLTWVSDNAYIDFPLLPNDTFSLGTLDKVGTAQTLILATGPSNDASNDISAAVLVVTNAIASGIRQEAIISTCVLLIWVIIALTGFCRAGMLFYKGGSEGVYKGPQPTSNASPNEHEKQVDDFLATRGVASFDHVPTYEQATTATTEPGDNTGNRFNGQSYTLTPNPLPSLSVNPATSPILKTGYSGHEKLGTVGGQNVEAAIRRPSHTRESNYGKFAVTSPTEPNLLSPIDRRPVFTPDLFADPPR